ncbi:MAG TPA: hypothetical protein GYA07_05645 [Verrucomicrobia bacterium]|nr:hypothetical protein [Verrucomicrobiota bacterium]HOB32087.1 hypothetical protein [Verrucomicrobiota bacterium]HOP98610.1 hypothetical protein [Verrucomicrobiota bacterium]HPU55027.1 hypothetical protein [Verrucomicrobiota bacterium]
MDAELLKILCCPETHQNLALAEPALIQQLNQRIASGELRNRAGQPVKETFEGGLIRSDGQYLYPIRQQIPVMLIEEAIPLQQNAAS